MFYRETLLVIPTDSTDSLNMPNEKVLTALLLDNNKVVVYEGNLADAVKNGALYETNYSTSNGLGKIVREKQKKLTIKFGFAIRSELMLLIKPTESSSYQNFRDALDEVMINDVKKYAVIELSIEEKIFIKKIK